MVSVISLASMSALSQAEEEVEVEEFGYGGAAGSKSGWPRPRPGYLPHRDDAGYDTAAGLGPSFQYFDEGDDLIRNSASGFLPQQYDTAASGASFFTQDPHGQSYKYHQEEADPRHAVGYKEFDVKPLSAAAPRYVQQRQLPPQQQQQPYGLDRNIHLSQRRYPQQQQQHSQYDHDRDNTTPRGYPQQQPYDRDRDNMSSRRYIQPSQMSQPSRPMRPPQAAPQHQQQPRQWY
jgi:hypothetical protein